MLHAHRARAHKIERVDVDALDIVFVGRCGEAGALAGEQLGGDALGVRFERRGAIGAELELSGEHLVDAPAQHRPGALADREVSSQIKQDDQSPRSCPVPTSETRPRVWRNFEARLT